MNKTEVYSWRISPATKAAIENEARREKTTVAALLDRITKEWIESRRGETDDAEQERLHARIDKTIGAISGNNPKRSERVREGVRHRLKRRYGR
jgi:hypothetical protein